jgi:uncharacterized phage protein (TIGR02218 family)
MTIYSDKETSVHGGQPIECFAFVGSYKTYRYTSGDLPVTVAGQLYTPSPIKRTNIKAGVHDEDNIEIKIEMPISVALIKDYGFQNTPPRLTLTIYRVHRGTDFAADYAIVWKGNILGFEIENNTATITIPSVFGEAMNGNLPSVFYQSPCNHVLFDSGCKISRAANTVTTSVLAISGTSVQIASVGGFPDGAFVGGEIADTAKNDRRMITAHVADLLTVNYAFSNMSVGAAVDVTLGCDHGFSSDCKLKFANQINFGGFPFIPSINPFESGI